MNMSLIWMPCSVKGSMKWPRFSTASRTQPRWGLCWVCDSALVFSLYSLLQHSYPSSIRLSFLLINGVHIRIPRLVSALDCVCTRCMRLFFMLSFFQGFYFVIWILFWKFDLCCPLPVYDPFISALWLISTIGASFLSKLSTNEMIFFFNPQHSPDFQPSLPTSHY